MAGAAIRAEPCAASVIDSWPSRTRRWAVVVAPAAEEPLGLTGELADDLGRWLHARDAADRLAGPVRHGLDRAAHVPGDGQLLEPAHGDAVAGGSQHLADLIALEGLGGRDGGAQGAVGGTRVVERERVAADGVRGIGGDQGLDVAGMGLRLLGGHEAGPDAYAVRSGG